MITVNNSYLIDKVLPKGNITKKVENN